jgi:hypothetical protein
MAGCITAAVLILDTCDLILFYAAILIPDTRYLILKEMMSISYSGDTGHFLQRLAYLNCRNKNQEKP